MAKKTEAVELLTGKNIIDCDYRPDVPADSLALVSAVGLTSVELIRNYKITSEDEFRQVFQIAQTAAIRKKAIVDAYADEESPLVKAHRAHVTLTTRRGQDVKPWDLIIDQSKIHMDAWCNERDRLKALEENRITKERQEQEARTAAEAKRLQDEADAAAKAARRQGDLREARRVQEEAAAKIEEFTRESAPIEVILPTSRPSISGLGESNPWIGALKNIMDVIRAVAGRPEHKCSKCGHVDPPQKGTDLNWNIAKAGAPQEIVALLDVNMKVPNFLAKRLGKADIGIPGLFAERRRDFRIGTKNADPGPKEPEGAKQSADGW